MRGDLRKFRNSMKSWRSRSCFVGLPLTFLDFLGLPMTFYDFLGSLRRPHEILGGSRKS